MAPLWTVLSATVRGAMHESMGKLNQDAVRVHRCARSVVLAVSDGHGSSRSFRSDRGAALATDCALRLVHQFERKNAAGISLSSARRQLERKLPSLLTEAWHRAVREDLAAHPFSPLEFAAFPDRLPVLHGDELPFSGYLAYGATLVVAAVTNHYYLYAQLGDGDILIVHPDGTVSRPWPREHAFFSTETVSLCSLHANAEFKVKVEARRGPAPALILIATDGYANCFADDAGFFRVGTEFLAYLQTGGIDFVKEKLEQWLNDSSRDGSRDDISIGVAVRMNALRRAPLFAWPAPESAMEDEPEAMEPEDA